ncbi:MAG: hypothetical protein DMF85_14790 [Acidobacteria bacterium]|nr:MAG: hypothetical protein DMF85_14790 [Acidobacteriota bacterium]
MRRVALHVADGVVLQVASLDGEFVSRVASTPPVFDDPRSYTLKLRDADITMDAEALTNLLRQRAFASPKSPVHDVDVRIEGNAMRVKGKLRKGIDVPFSMTAEVSTTPEGLMRLHGASLKTAGVPVKGLLDLLGVNLDDLAKMPAGSGIRAEQDDLLIDATAILPPPATEGRLQRLQVRDGAVQMHMTGTASPPPRPRTLPVPSARNYLYFYGGTIRFGKLTMTDADMQHGTPRPQSFHARLRARALERRYPEDAAGPMNILLLSMPDSFEHTPALTMRMPNGALASLAGNLDRHHHVAVADLILVQDRVADTVTRLVGEHNPGVVGLSVMTFQRRTALRLIRLIRRLLPETVIVAGGYDASLAPEAYEPPELGIDYLVRGEGELTFRALVRALEHGQPLDAIAGLSYRSDGGAGSVFVHNPARDVSHLNDREVALPNRAARVLSGYTFLGRPIDIVETSRGCTYLPHVRFLARARRHRRRPRPRLARDLHRGRQRHAERRAVRGALRRDRGRGAERRALPRAGDDVVDREPRRHAGADDAQGRLPLCVSRDRERARRRPRVPSRVGEERAARARTPDRQRDDARDRLPAPRRHLRRRRDYRRQSRRHARVDPGEPRLRAAVRGLAVHPASDAISRDADDRRFPPAAPHRQRTARGV